MADQAYSNVVLLDNYRGRGPRGSEVFSPKGCVREILEDGAKCLTDAQQKHRCNPSVIAVQISGAK